MGSTVCRPSTSSFVECGFEESSFLKSFRNKNPYNWNSVIFTSIGVVCLLLLWIVSCCIRHRDFTRFFVICQLIPYTVAYVCKLATVVYEHLSYQHLFYSGYIEAKPFWEEPVRGIYNMAVTTTGLNLPMGTLVFLIMNLYAANARKMVSQGASWGLYFLTLLVSLIVGCGNLLFIYNSSVQSIYAVAYNWLARACIFGCSCCLVMILFAACFCTKSHVGQCSDPPVSNAKSRMIWTIPFVLLAFQPLCYGLLVTDIFRSISYYSTTNEVFFAFVDTLILADMIDPIILTIAVILFLPAYRSTLFCSQDYKKSKIVDSSSVEAAKRQRDGIVQVATPSSVPHTITNISTPVPPAPINQIQRHYDANLVTMLTTPTAMYNQPNTLALSQSVGPSCNCQQSAFPATYQLVHQPTYSTIQTSCPHHHQGHSLIRFASQPNLITPATLQPAVSMPQMNTIYVG